MAHLVRDYTALLPDEILAEVLMYVLRADPGATPSLISQRYRHVMRDLVRPRFLREFGLWPLYEAGVLEPEYVFGNITETMVRVGGMLQFDHYDHITFEDGSTLEISESDHRLCGVSSNREVAYFGSYPRTLCRYMGGLWMEIQVGENDCILGMPVVNDTHYALVMWGGARNCVSLHRMDYDADDDMPIVAGSERPWIDDPENDTLLVVENPLTMEHHLVHVYTEYGTDDFGQNITTFYAKTYDGIIDVQHQMNHQGLIQCSCVGTGFVIWFVIRVEEEDRDDLVSWNLRDNVINRIVLKDSTDTSWRSMVVSGNWLLIARSDGEDEDIIEVRKLRTSGRVLSSKELVRIPFDYPVDTMLTDVRGNVCVRNTTGFIFKYKIHV